MSSKQRDRNSVGLKHCIIIQLSKIWNGILNNKQNISEIRKTFLWVQDQEQSESSRPQQHQWLSGMIFNKPYKKLWQNQSLKINDRKWHRKEKERNYSCHSWFSSVPYQFQAAVLESSFNLSQLSQLHSSAIKNWDIFTLITSNPARELAKISCYRLADRPLSNTLTVSWQHLPRVFASY